jgi:deoxyhypusine synthase
MKENCNSLKKIHPLNIRKDMDIKDLITEYKKGVFGGGKIAEAVDIYTDMLKNECTIFLGVAGALVPAGLGKIIADLIKDGMVHVIVSTGANITHDLIEAFGGSHLKGIDIKEKDAELRDKGIDRIYDAFIEDESFVLLEKNICNILDEMEGLMSVSEFLRMVGSKLDSPDSFIKQAYKHDVPVFAPGITDSILGLHTFLYSQEHPIQLDHIKDIGKMVELTSTNTKKGAIFLGGGIPKNYIFQAMLLSDHTFEYAVQITTDRPEYGGLSGATLEEAISWGKVAKDSHLCTVYCDCTIAFPLIVAGVRSCL